MLRKAFAVCLLLCLSLQHGSFLVYISHALGDSPVEYTPIHDLIISDEALSELISNEVEVIDQEDGAQEKSLIRKNNDSLQKKGNGEAPSSEIQTVIIKYTDGATVSGSQIAQNTLNTKFIGENSQEILEEVEMSILKIDSSQNTESKIQTTLKKLENLPHIEYIEQDQILTLHNTDGVSTNDTHSDKMWHLRSIYADQAWELYNDESEKTIVSVNDTGIDYTHADLTKNLHTFTNDQCKKHDGSDLSNCSLPGRSVGEGSVLDANNPYDLDGHGTHVAGIIAAEKNNNLGSVGVSQNISLLATRIETYENNFEIFYLSDAIKGVDFALQNGAKIINASYGGGTYSQAQYDSIQRAQQNGTIFVTSAGNSGANNDTTTHYPSNYDLDNIVVVGALSKNDTLAYYSNYGATSVDILAPGGEITDTITGEGGIYSSKPKQTEVFSEDFEDSSDISAFGGDWGLASNGGGVYTQIPTYYEVDSQSTLVFDKNFSLSGSYLATLEGNVSCNFGSNGVFDSDRGDYVDFVLRDMSDGTTQSAIKIDSGVIGAGTYRFKSPISAEYKSNVRLEANFVTDSDDDVGMGCWFDDLSIISHTQNANEYQFSQGTSMASPIVSGVLGMLWSYAPNLSYSEIINIAYSSTTPLGLNDKALTGGKINAENALLELISRHGIQKHGSILERTLSLKSIELAHSGSSDFTNSILSLTGGEDTINLGSNVVLAGDSEFFLPEDFTITIAGESATPISTPEWKFTNSDEQEVMTQAGGYDVTGEGIYIDFTDPSIDLENTIKITVSNDTEVLYDGAMKHSTLIPLSQDYTGILSYSLYFTGEIHEQISDNHVFIVESGESPLINFTHAERTIELYEVSENKEAGQDISLSLRIKDYDGGILEEYNAPILFSFYKESEAQEVSIHSDIVEGMYNFESSNAGEKTFSDLVSYSTSGTKTATISGSHNHTKLNTEYIFNILDRSIPTGTISFSKGIVTNSRNITTSIDFTELPTDYSISGDVKAINGNASQNLENIPLTLNPEDGSKRLQFDFSDEDNNSSNEVKTLILDTTLPQIEFSQETEGLANTDEFSITSTLSDINGIESFTFNGAIIELGENNTQQQVLNLEYGKNTFAYSIEDIAGNIATGEYNIHRVSKVEQNSNNAPTKSTLTISAQSETAVQVLLEYGTQENLLNQSLRSELGTEHTFELEGLSSSTNYFYRLSPLYNGSEEKLGVTESFITESDIIKGGHSKSKGGSRPSTKISESLKNFTNLPQQTSLLLNEEVPSNIQKIEVQRKQSQMNIAGENITYTKFESPVMRKKQILLFSELRKNEAEEDVYDVADSLLQNIDDYLQDDIDITLRDSYREKIMEDYILLRKKLYTQDI